jgi:arylsulfatase A-like enzyme/uncharacterized membrane protein YbhN (UPF0104 family)
MRGPLADQFAAPAGTSMNRKRALFLAKLVLSLSILSWVYVKLLGASGASELWQRITHLAWGWLVFGFGMQLAAVCCSVLRWQRLLIGQGIHAPLSHLFGSFLIGRFFGEFAPGGWTGLNGYRIYDISKHTGKVARATACIGIEMVLGWLSFGAVVVGGSFFGVRFVGWSGVLIVDAFFLTLISVALLLVSRPVLFRTLAQRLSATIAGKLRTTTDAVCAYEGRGTLVVQAALLGVGTHVCRAFIYVGAARALAADLSVGEVFFGSSLQVFATLLPASVNGIGLREATAVALYTRGGIPESTAVLIPTLGFLLEMLLSSFGGLVFMARRVGYQPQIRVDDADREAHVHAQLAPVPEAAWPKLWPSTTLGLGAGLLAGAALGCSEGMLVLAGSASDPDFGVLAYGATVYALVLGSVGALLAFVSALSGRLMQREAARASSAYARGAAGLFALCAFAIGAFRVRRDYFHEELVWKSPHGMGVLLACALCAIVAFAIVNAGLRTLVERRALLLRPWGTPLVVVGLVVLLTAAVALDGADAARAPVARPQASTAAKNILLIVVDTLRADRLPSYGYRPGRTPALDRFAQDALRFDAAFANASWTRPSFASILSGRFAASHRTMAKSDALPEEITTLPEVLRAGGYQTYAVVTNYNIAPFFNFHQGFDEYLYLEPSFVLGANDSAAKLLFVQALRQSIETVRAKRGHIEVGSAYQDAPTVTANVLGAIDRKSAAPFFVLAAYMDPHDPYYPHPYDGSAYARAAHPKPAPEEAPSLSQLYDGEITFWDESFGQLIDALKQRGLYDDMTIVVTSDHGEEFFEHGGYWHGATLYDEALHVPLLVKLPGNEMHGTVLRHLVQSIDLMPSLLKLVGLPIPEGVQGQDLFNAHDNVFAEESHEGNVLRALRMQRAGSALKLIEANPGNPRGLAARELYQVDQDPAEQVNLVDERPELLQLSQQALATEASHAAEGRATQKSVNIPADSTVAERLRALGYAGGEKND